MPNRTSSSSRLTFRILTSMANAHTRMMSLISACLWGAAFERELSNDVPLSRAKDHVIRLAVVVMPIAQDQVKASKAAPLTMAPAMFRTVFWQSRTN